MKKCSLLILFLSLLAFLLAAVPAYPYTYTGYDKWGDGTWHDAEKLPGNAEDDLMCWAAAAANILDWEGWTAGFHDHDAIFQYFQDHWTDEGGLMEYGWDWWFDGTNPSEGWSGWSQVDVPGGGFYDPPHHFNTYYHEQNNDSQALSAIDAYLHSGYGVTAAIYTDAGGGHAVTIWGYDFDVQYKGLWITDSDDDKSNPNPPDSLRYYDVALDGGRWFLQDYYGTSDTWHIGSVQALDRAPIPLPPAILLLLSGLAGLIGLRRSVSQR